MVRRRRWLQTVRSPTERLPIDESAAAFLLLSTYFFAVTSCVATVLTCECFAAATKFTLRFTFTISIVPRRVCYLTRDAPKPPTNCKPNVLFHSVSVLVYAGFDVFSTLLYFLSFNISHLVFSSKCIGQCSFCVCCCDCSTSKIDLH